MNPNQSSDIYIGLMSGTSLDGIDIAIIDFASSPPSILYTDTNPYTGELRQKLCQLTQSQTTTLDDLYSLEAEITQTYADSVGSALDHSKLSKDRIAALGCHGQTIRHRPDADPAYTAQLGDAGRLAVLTGITTVADFRRKDIALGGQGAPLASAFHQFLFRTEQENRVVVNIGGIANITYLPAKSNQPVTGFDTGPGNTLLDHWIATHKGETFDCDGEWARSGRVIDALLEQMLTNEAYFTAQPPKSTGTEYFNPQWLAPWLDSAYAPVDVQATLAELTASTVSAAIISLPGLVESCFICGGGARNAYLCERIQAALPEVEVKTTASLGIDPDFVEASAFAWLARSRLQLHPGNLPGVTEASHAAVLGGVYHAD